MVTMCKGDATCNSKFLDLRSGVLVLGFKLTQMKLGKKRKKEKLENNHHLCNNPVTPITIVSNIKQISSV